MWSGETPAGQEPTKYKKKDEWAFGQKKLKKGKNETKKMQEKGTFLKNPPSERGLERQPNA